ncbi:metal ABC transporter permease [Pelagicoccus sp. SDUM812003]|uniref:metal ABC transporter permease n=1 Tax=Pelagicoccus sp. SDUM812003 TaxID=3041267 RepID=UPI00281060ED|nr:metal ABC transporter permease [Pelagicoccus sp. SDUM812003]MDQ8202334.1 metal ABC transporter permease [Pelagicoccus sp. SDUM812003]
MDTMNMWDHIFPSFDFNAVFVEPWTEFAGIFVWIGVMGFLVTAACGFIGTFIVWRRMALVGDAISHSVLPGIVIAFLVSQSRDTLPMFIGAVVAGVVTTLLIEVIHQKSRIKTDAALGIVFTTLFAIGVVLVSLYGENVDLDTDCVLYGEIEQVTLEPLVSVFGWFEAPPSVLRMAVVTLVTISLVGLFYRPLVVSSFDPGMAKSIGINPAFVHHALMSLLAIVVVSSFEAVGAVLVIAILIFPATTASLLSDRLPVILGLTLVIALLASFFGLHLALWLDVSTAGSISVVVFALFLLAWVFAPRRGLLVKAFRQAG